MKSPRIWQGVYVVSASGSAATSAEVIVIGRRWTLW